MCYIKDCNGDIGFDDLFRLLLSKEIQLKANSVSLQNLSRPSFLKEQRHSRAAEAGAVFSLFNVYMVVFGERIVDIIIITPIQISK